MHIKSRQIISFDFQRSLLSKERNGFLLLHTFGNDILCFNICVLILLQSHPSASSSLLLPTKVCFSEDWNSRVFSKICPVLRYWCLAILFQTANLVEVKASEEDRIRAEILPSSHCYQIPESVHWPLYSRLDWSHMCSKTNVAPLVFEHMWPKTNVAPLCNMM